LIIIRLLDNRLLFEMPNLWSFAASHPAIEIRVESRSEDLIDRCMDFRFDVVNGVIISLEGVIMEGDDVVDTHRMTSCNGIKPAPQHPERMLLLIYAWYIQQLKPIFVNLAELRIANDVLPQ